MSPFYAIVNGAAGGGRCRARADAALSRLGARGVELELHFTEAPGHATELAREGWDAGHRRFLAVGGDGTAFEVLNGLMPRAAGDDVPVMGILPLGTGNSFLRDFDILDESTAIEALGSGRTRRCDAVRVRHRDGELYYMNIFALGFAAGVGELTNKRFKPLGTAGYGLAVLVEVARLDTPVDPLRLDGSDAVDQRSALFLSFCNSRFTGGTMMMAPDADVTDGQVDIIRVGPMSRSRLVGALPRLYKGTHVELPEVEHTRARRVDFEVERSQAVMVDGEVMSLALRSLEVVPGAVEVIA